MYKEGKRRPIKNRVLFIIMMVSLISISITSIIGIYSMMNIRLISEKALVSDMELNMTNTVLSNANMADTQLRNYRDQIQIFADQIHDIYSSPENYIPREIPELSAENEGRYVFQLALANKDIDMNDEALVAERELLSGIESALYPYININSEVIAGIYLGTETGQILAYDTHSSFKKVMGTYNFFKSEWYSKAKEFQDVYFTNVYLDSFGKGMTVSVAAPFYDADNNFAGVIAMDVLVADLYDTITNLEFADGSYPLLIDNNGNIITTELEEKELVNEESMDTETAEKILSGECGVSLTDKNAYYVYAPIAATNWKYCIYVPKSVVLASTETVNKNIIISIAEFIVVLLITIVVVIFVARSFAIKITKPLLALREDASKISSGDLEHKAKVESNDEIGDLAVDFNTMSDRLKDYIKNLTEITAKEERAASELLIATKIQESALPRIFPPFPDRKEINLYASMRPAKEVGGDFYDFYFIDNDHLALTIADVSGKGVPGALFMMISKMLLKNQSSVSISPKDILTVVNNQLCENNEAEMFVTVFLGIIDLRTGVMTAANAGHEYPAIKKAGGKFELFKDKHGMVLGGLAGVKYKEYEIQFEPGDTLYLYTDGVAEATDMNNELFGTDRMIESLNQDPEASVEKMAENLIVAVDSFVGDAPQFDDITMLCMHYNGNTGDV